MTYIRLLAFTILVPGTVAGGIPFELSHHAPHRFDIGDLRYIGILFMVAGAVFYAWTALAFLLKGGGTPALWITSPLSRIIGEEPGKLVTAGLYKRSRNPMYVGVMGFVLGTGILIQSSSICIYALGLFVFFNMVILLIEEPHLKRKFGASYEEYLGNTPRWIRFR